MEEDDDVPTLSAETFAALQEFYAEQEKRQEILNKLEADNKLKENILFDENWVSNLPSSWGKLLRATQLSLRPGRRPAWPPCPIVWQKCRQNSVTCRPHRYNTSGSLTLLEYDRRFEVHAPDFIYYDYNNPEKLPPDTHGSYDLVVADPPFLSEECITKTSQTINLLKKSKVIVCTGAIMKENVERLLGLKVCEFQPRHRNNLANEFSCYANFNLDEVLR
ncbi:hypothetical protein K1T71_010600 [Dendrolimus kikuchii]|uniref:Uncharacterized protein n=1 Tax=Dendrolimus kikuchii TaxID=765133 RepID=A0ACC1CPQ7_9NEOP|nr:hypothetical protein K1T71_010600 [Dendrolimus kikuchii]